MRLAQGILFIAGILPLGATVPTYRAALAFDAGYLTAQKSVAYALSGEFEIYQAPALGLTQGGRVSLRSDLYGFITQNPAASLAQNYQALVGLSFQLGELAGLLPFAGFQPGFGLAAPRGGSSALYAYPLLSPVFGMHYFFARGIHLTFNVRYVFGEFNYRNTGSVYLSEARGALGLGFQW